MYETLQREQNGRLGPSKFITLLTFKQNNFRKNAFHIVKSVPLEPQMPSVRGLLAPVCRLAPTDRQTDRHAGKLLQPSNACMPKVIDREHNKTCTTVKYIREVSIFYGGPNPDDL